MKQPFIGILATAMMIALSLAIVWQFDFATLTSWTAWLFMCATPTLVLICVTWGGNPAFAARLGQPVKGLLLLVLTCAAGAVVAAATFFLVGDGLSPPGPVLVIFAILTVIVMFWLTIMFGGWPFNRVVKSELGAGVLLLAACYGISYLLFQLFFDFGFLRGAPIYVEPLDPSGMFNAHGALVFAVTATGVLFLLLHFESRFRALARLGPARRHLPAAGAVRRVLRHVAAGPQAASVMAFLLTLPSPGDVGEG